MKFVELSTKLKIAAYNIASATWTLNMSLILMLLNYNIIQIN